MWYMSSKYIAIDGKLVNFSDIEIKQEDSNIELSFGDYVRSKNPAFLCELLGFDYIDITNGYHNEFDMMYLKK